MDTVKLQKRLAKHKLIALIWSVEDVQALRPDLTDEEAFSVLQQCERRHDAEIGVNWDVIQAHLDELFPENDSAQQEE